MRTLFSQEAVWEIKRYNVPQEGRQVEFAKGVRSIQKAGLDDAKKADNAAPGVLWNPWFRFVSPLFI